MSALATIGGLILAALVVAYAILVLMALVTVTERLALLVDLVERLVTIDAERADRERHVYVTDAAEVDAHRAMRPQG